MKREAAAAGLASEGLALVAGGAGAGNSGRGAYAYGGLMSPSPPQTLIPGLLKPTLSLSPLPPPLPIHMGERGEHTHGGG